MIVLAVVGLFVLLVSVPPCDGVDQGESPAIYTRTDGALVFSTVANSNASVIVNGVDLLQLIDAQEMLIKQLRAQLCHYTFPPIDLSLTAVVDINHFVIDGATYIFVSKQLESSTSSTAFSTLYRWDAVAVRFVFVQNILTIGASGSAFTTIADTAGNERHFLAVANQVHIDFPQVSFETTSLILEWSPSSNEFEPFQSVPSLGASGVTFFAIDGVTFLAWAFRADDEKTPILNSTILRWDADEDEFVLLQSIETMGAFSWTHFRIEQQEFLAVANEYLETPMPPVNFEVDSVIFLWDAANEHFVEFQRIRTAGARSWTPFTINAGHYLLVSNHRSNNGYVTDSELFVWEATPSPGRFTSLQNITLSSPRDAEYFAIDGVSYVAFATAQSASDTISDETEIYRWDPDTLRLVPFQTVASNGAVDTTFFTIDGVAYLAVSNRQSGPSTYDANAHIHVWNNCHF